MADQTDQTSSPVQFGFTVVMRENGTIDFDLIGDPKPLEIMGLHSFVGHKLHEPFVAEMIQDSQLKILENIKGLYSALGRIVQKMNDPERLPVQSREVKEPTE